MRCIGFDVAKGLAICLVVVFHSLQGVAKIPSASETISLTSYYFSLWLMPVFFIISAVLSVNSIKGVNSSVYKKGSELLYIYVLWSLIIYLVRLLFDSITNTNMEIDEILYILWDPLPTIWFVYALLLSYLFTWVLRNVNGTLVIFGAFLLSVFNYYTEFFSGTIMDRFCWIYIFYVIGYFYSDTIIDFFNRKGYLVLTFLTFLTLSISLFYLGEGFFPFFLFPFISLVLAFSFIRICFFLTAFIHHKVLDLLTFLGVISLYIYLTHFPLPAASRVVLGKIGFTNELLMVLAPMMVAVLIGFVCYKLVRFRIVKAMFSFKEAVAIFKSSR
ncbi:acyltransferase family protein [Amphritea japonica]|uniref:Acyltransferase 3 n=1 Tax=Amphritea japonica ATCC BAA-1530 TaxID=1278309 RepID=A0A7R6SSD5_9GAMM|nr:acyltransferase [Amphritea japonica]BBB25457.1 acyltransferase 3 [Amphritea japonica ATCC BAA-1530]